MIVLPIYWVNEKVRAKSTTHLVGANFFRNAHFHVKNKMKQDYHELVAREVNSNAVAPVTGEYTLEIDIYYKNVSSDGSNVASLIEKFVLDALQETGTVEQDSVRYHLGTTWKVAGKDKENPRAEVKVIKV